MRSPKLFLLGPLVLMAMALPIRAQSESQFHAELSSEGDKFKESCAHFDLKSIEGCAEQLFTGHPFHIAVGSIAPQNGFGAGLGFVTHFTPNERWRLSWNADAVASNNGSWRAGAYMKAIYIPEEKIVMKPGGAGKPRPRLAVRPYPVFNLYAQSISLNKVGYFGIGPDSKEENRSFFGLRETIVGTSAVVPVLPRQRLNLSVFGEANGRFVDIRGSHGQDSPSIEQAFTELGAPGQTNRPAFAQFGEGIRIRPVCFAGQPCLLDHVRLNYSLTFQQFVAVGDARFSFRRLTVDLAHEIPLYRTTRTLYPSDTNGPDDCGQGTDAPHDCPRVSRNREGSIGIRLLISHSMVPDGHVVPFFFQQTLGGSDINGNPSLASYQDYRFRGPDIMLLRASFEHSIYGPLGFSFAVDEGKVAVTGSDLDFKHLAHSYSAGLTLRAGGFPQVWLLFAWGGHEGTHTTAAMNTSLLGGAARPSLF